MKYKDYLTESIDKNERKKAIELDECVKIFKDHCKKYDLDSPFIRGYTSDKSYMIVQGDISKRTSRTGSNHANMIIDVNIQDSNKSYPRRQYSTIFSSPKAKEHALQFGTRRYIIIPYDDCMFGYCEGIDLNYIEMPDMGDAPYGSAIGLSKFLKMNDISDDDINSMAEECAALSSDEYAMSKFKKMFDGCDTIPKAVERLKSLLPLDKLKIKFTKDLNKLQDDIYEIWTNGKCLLIEEHLYKEFVEKVNGKKLDLNSNNKNKE